MWKCMCRRMQFYRTGSTVIPNIKIGNNCTVGAARNYKKYR